MENNNYVKLKSNGFIGKIISETKTAYKIKLLDTSTIIQINKKLVDIVDDKKTIYKLNDKTKPKISLRYTIDTDKNFEPEIMLRHQNEIEAIENLDNFIFKALKNHSKRIRIIHGRHGGILREAVHEYLKNSPYVEKYSLADNTEGSIGVTIAYLK